MTTDSSSAPEVPSSARRRLLESKRRYEQDKLYVWDHLTTPQTFDELIMLIEDHRDSNMFYPLMGMPRAYMEVPTGLEGVPYFRWIYQVLRFGMRGTREETEGPLAAHFWEIFVALRKEYEFKYPESDPILLWRRLPEIGTEGGITWISMRFAIPGLDLHPSGRLEFWNDQPRGLDRYILPTGGRRAHKDK